MQKLILPLIILMTLTLTLTACSSEKTITRLTNNASDDLLDYIGIEGWSPDGSKIVFYSERDGIFEKYTMNADGTNQTNISNEEEADRPTSPDGSKIAFISPIDGNFEIYVMDY